MTPFDSLEYLLGVQQYVVHQEGPKSSVEFRKNFSGIVAIRTKRGASTCAQAGVRCAAIVGQTVAKLTSSNERAVRNWFDGKNSPSADNLVILMRHSDQILRTVLELADRRDLVLAVGLDGLRAQLVDVLSAIDEVQGS